MSKSLTYGGVDLSVYGLQVNDFDIPKFPFINFKSHKAHQGDSERSAINQTHRTIKLNVSVVGDTQSHLRSRFDTILSILDPARGDKSIQLDDFPDRRFIGIIRNMSAPTQKGRWGEFFTIDFEVNAHAQGLTETNLIVAIATDPDTLATSVITGNVNRIPAEIYIRNTTGGTLTNQTISIQNVTTSETITVRMTLEDDRWLRVGDLDADGVFTASLAKSDSTGADPEAEAYTSVLSSYSSGDWLRLKGGVSNSIIVTGISTGTLEITYRPKYL